MHILCFQSTTRTQICLTKKISYVFTDAFFIFRDRVQIICRVRKSFDFAAVIAEDLGVTLSFIRTKSEPGYDKSGDKARFMVACLLDAAPSLPACAYGPLAVHV